MIEKTFEAKKENLQTVLDFLESELINNGCNMKILTSLLIAMEELFINVASYAYPDNNGDATIIVDFKDNDLYLTLIDSGIEFNPLAKEDPNIKASAEERQIGGLGIFMVKKTMDDMSYKREDNKNILMMKKRIKE